MARRQLEPGERSKKASCTPQRRTETGSYVRRAAGDKRRADRWRASVRVGGGDGISRQVQAYGETERDALAALDAALARGAGQVSDAAITSETTVAELAREWLGTVERAGDLATGSLRIYRLTVERYVLPPDGGKARDGRGTIAGLRLRQVSPARIEGALRAVLDAEPGKGVGTVKTLRTVLRGMFDLALRHDALAVNPVRMAGAIRPKRERSQHRTHLEPGEVLALIARADADDDERRVSRDLGDLVAFLAATGARIGEACALRWSEVDLAGERVQIGGRTVVRLPEGGGLKIEDHGRTKEGQRWFALSGSVVQRLRRRKIGQAPNALGLVFPAARSASLRDPSNTAHHMRDLLDSAGLQDVRGSHIFRKTVATVLNQAGLSDREVANALGHRDTNTTKNTYMSRSTVTEQTATLLDWSAAT